MSTRFKNASPYQNRQREVEIRNASEHAHFAADHRADKQEHPTPHEQTRLAMEHRTPTTQDHGVTAFNHEDIAALAYRHWQERGRPDGSPEQDWFHAVKELRSRATNRQ